MATPAAAKVSDVTVHCAGPPWPVRANSKPVGAAPGVILSIAIMMAPVSARPPDAAHAKAHARAVAARMRFPARDYAGVKITPPADGGAPIRAREGSARGVVAMH